MAENILLIRLKSIGDVLLTLPAVAAVRQNFPDAKITYLTSHENSPLLRGFREVDEVIALDRAALRTGNPLRVAPKFLGLLRQLRAGKFELVVDFQGNGETGWLTRFTGARRRWGGVYNPGQGWAYTQRVARPRNVHPAETNLELLRQCGLAIGAPKNEFALPAEALAAAKKYFSSQQLDPDGRTLFLQPLTSSPQKNWPLENFLELARCWRAQGGQVIFGGGPSDREILQPAAAAGFAVSAGVPLLVTGGLMKLSTLTVGGDTGALHLAVALGRRVVMLMHGMKAGSPHPFGQPGWAVGPEKTTDISKISVATVRAACNQALNAPAGSVFC